MYLTLLIIHSWLRWLVLLLAILVIFRSLSGLFGKKPYLSADNKSSLYFTIGMHTQLLLGLLLYFWFSPFTLQAFKNFGAAMKDGNLRFWAVEHIFAMVLAVVIAQIGRSATKKASTDVKKHRRSAIYTLLALVLILSMIPWKESARLFRF